MRSVFFLLLITFCEAAFSQPCLDEVRVSRLLEKFDVRQAPPQGSKAEPSPIQLDRCDTSSLNYVVVETLLFLQDLPKFQSEKDEFDENIIGASAEEFLAGRVDMIMVDSEENKMCSGATLAYASNIKDATTDKEIRVMRVCPHVSKFSMVVRLGVLIHEARHYDSNDEDPDTYFGHSICQFGEMAGAIACDATYSKGGAYAAEAELYVKMWRSETLPAEVRLEARGWAIDRLSYRFNTNEFGLERKVLTAGLDGILYISDGHEAPIPFVSGIAPDAIVSIRSNMPLVFDREAGSIMSYSYGQWTATTGAFSQLIRNMPVEERRQAVDIYYGKFACLLFPTEMLCKKDTVITRIKMPEGVRAAQFVPIREVFAGVDVVLFRAEDGSMYAMPTPEDLNDWTTEKLTPAHKLVGFKGLATMPEFHRIAILADGQMGYIPKDGFAYELLPSFKGMKFGTLLAPFYYSEKFNEL